ncbi:cytidine/deoxycytidylate deaminase family protein, partial [bacterium]|nr:cytidine/deoxycytidylate deaminase family protein [bacterium]
MRRPSWDEYFLQIVSLVSKRSTCLKSQQGAIMVKDKRILTTGYNGAPRGLPHCIDIGCLRDEEGLVEGEKLEICRGLHAVQNAIIQAGLYGARLKDSSLYINHSLCTICGKMIINAGVSKVVTLSKRMERPILDLFKK